MDEVGGNLQLSINYLQDLFVDEFDRAKVDLFHTFAQLNPPSNFIPQWSLDAEAGWRILLPSRGAGREGPVTYCIHQLPEVNPSRTLRPHGFAVETQLVPYTRL